MSDLTLRSKGTGWVIGLTATGAYVECFLQDGVRLIECNFYDGANRDVRWTRQALRALTWALHWQDTGEMPNERI